MINIMKDFDYDDQEESATERIYNFLVEHITEKGYAPTYRELGNAVGLSSSSSIHNHLEKLELLGKIQMEEHKPRAIRLVGYKFVKVG